MNKNTWECCNPGKLALKPWSWALLVVLSHKTDVDRRLTRAEFLKELRQVAVLLPGKDSIKETKP